MGAAVTRVLLEGMKVNTIRRDQGGIALHVDLGPLPLDQAPARCEKLAAFVKEAAAEGVPNHRASWGSGMMLR
ncbi:hypothetical protein [Blastococcus sp. CT_GayMR20]|uniref:hypothetical protein n=1 Tax=Blastococcus sp. CT_GayMR20 TaxID=2559609 RepID=UPI001FD7940D|nr:hypothetical protein [Blastococcus sp. CT_GayMR20]